MADGRGELWLDKDLAYLEMEPLAIHSSLGFLDFRTCKTQSGNKPWRVEGCFGLLGCRDLLPDDSLAGRARSV